MNGHMTTHPAHAHHHFPRRHKLFQVDGLTVLEHRQADCVLHRVGELTQVGPGNPPDVSVDDDIVGKADEVQAQAIAAVLGILVDQTAGF